jgi:hypothetical protein
MALSRPGSEAWANAVGRFLMNFGVVELMTNWWVHSLDESVDLTTFRTLKFSVRVSSVLKAVKQSSLEEASKNIALTSWRRTRALAKLRNQVAHNPSCFWWSTDDHSGPPDEGGILLYTDLEPGSSAPIPVLTLPRIREGITESNNVVEVLWDRLAELRRISGK